VGFLLLEYKHAKREKRAEKEKCFIYSDLNARLRALFKGLSASLALG
jgi:hypothetical protein